MHLQITNIATIRPTVRRYKTKTLTYVFCQPKIHNENFDICMSVSLRQTMKTLTYACLSA